MKALLAEEAREPRKKARCEITPPPESEEASQETRVDTSPSPKGLGIPKSWSSPTPTPTKQKPKEPEPGSGEKGKAGLEVLELKGAKMGVPLTKSPEATEEVAGLDSQIKSWIAKGSGILKRASSSEPDAPSAEVAALATVANGDFSSCPTKSPAGWQYDYWIKEHASKAERNKYLNDKKQKVQRGDALEVVPPEVEGGKPLLGKGGGVVRGRRADGGIPQPHRGG